MRRCGVDLGGTKIEAIVLEEHGETLFRERVDTPRGDYTGTVEALCGLVERAERIAGPCERIGIGTPGAISPASGLMKNCNSVVLNGRPLRADIQQRLKREVRLANDANCFALSEATDGAAAGAPIVFGVIIGTGCGAGIVVNGQVLTGVNAIAGEWGHNPLPWPRDEEQPGPSCYCGRQGCIETWLSGTGFENDHVRSGGEPLSARQIVERAEAGDALALASLARYEERLARGLAHVINILDPQVIVLGGGMSNVTRLYESVPRLWAPHVFSDRVDTRLVPPIHGDSSGVRGAAWL